MRPFRLVLRLSVLLLTAAACAQQSLEPARQAFQARDLVRAEAESRSFLKQQPGSADGMYLLGRILEARNQPRESLAWFTRAAAIVPPHGDDLRVVGMDYVLLDDYPDAVHWLSRSVELDTGNPEAWYDLGRARMMLGDLHGAQQPLERSLALQPQQSRVANNLGVIAEGSNQPAQAEALYRQAIEWQRADPHPGEQPLLNLGRMLLASNRAAEALPLLQKAEVLAPRDTQVNEQLAKAEEQNGHTAQALAAMKTAVALEPASAHLHYELGQMLRRAGQKQAATEELKLSGTLYGTHSTDRNP